MSRQSHGRCPPRRRWPHRPGRPDRARAAAAVCRRRPSRRHRSSSSPRRGAVAWTRPAAAAASRAGSQAGAPLPRRVETCPPRTTHRCPLWLSRAPGRCPRRPLQPSASLSSEASSLRLRPPSWRSPMGGAASRAAAARAGRAGAGRSTTRGTAARSGTLPWTRRSRWGPPRLPAAASTSRPRSPSPRRPRPRSSASSRRRCAPLHGARTRASGARGRRGPTPGAP
mmetsp:Transcript_17745/g.55046  ORF Transcript_17745/g.55046 Transcript_17745/m.55046 type:complete len:226 (-) Transcript_17745:137-814(-)